MPLDALGAGSTGVRARPSWAGLRGRALRLLDQVGHPFASIFFIPNAWIGLLLALAFATRPEHAAFAAVGLVVGGGVNRALRLVDRPGSGGGSQANAVLAALVTAWLTGSIGAPLGVRLLLAAAAALPAALLAAALMRSLARSAMPAVLLGYCTAAAMLFTVCPQCTVAASNAMPPWPPLDSPAGWVEAFLRSLGALMYGTDWVSGAFVLLAVLVWSRSMLLCGIAGWIGGALLALAVQRLGLGYYWLPLSYNFFLAGLVLGAVLFLPGRAGLAIAAAAGALTSFFALALQYALGGSSTSYLPLSSALAVWVGLGALAHVGVRPWAGPGDADAPPERQWWQWALSRARFGAPVPLFAVPVAGELLVTQGFGGTVSHKGPFRHALDFQRPGPVGAGVGAIAGAAVTSPVDGMVERVRNHVADNPPGACNYAEPWGNYVVIRLPAGGWVLLAHLQQGSVPVAPGAVVEVGTYLGRVGNSGRSTHAHLHLHLQDGPEPGSPTRPFRLANYLLRPAGEQPWPWVVSAEPAQGDVVVAAPRNPALHLCLARIAPGSAIWTAETSGEVPRAYRRDVAAAKRVDVAIDSLGRHVFTAGTGSLVARLDPDAWRVSHVEGHAHSLLRLLALAASTVPYAARPGTAWSDLPPLEANATDGGGLALAFAPYRREPFPRTQSVCMAEPAGANLSLEVRSRIEPRSGGQPLEVSCTFSALKGPVALRARFAHGSVCWTLVSFDPGGAPHATPRPGPSDLRHP